MVATFFLFKTPWVIPGLIILGGIVTNFSSKRYPENEKIKPRQIRWTNIWLFVLVFLIAGLLSETARKQDWKDRKAYNLFENFYRFGSFVEYETFVSRSPPLRKSAEPFYGSFSTSACVLFFGIRIKHCCKNSLEKIKWSELS